MLSQHLVVTSSGVWFLFQFRFNMFGLRVIARSTIFTPSEDEFRKTHTKKVGRGLWLAFPFCYKIAHR